MTSCDYKVDVLILTYNHERFIQNALDSILNQRTNFNFRLVIGDDKSTDGTADILRAYKTKFGGKIDIVTNEIRLGTHGNFMRTWSRCRTEYIAMCEGDDGWLTDSKLQRQVDFLEANREFNLCASRSRLVYDDESRTGIYPLKYSQRPSKRETIYMGMFQTASVVLRRGNAFELPSWFPDSWVVDLPLWAYARQEGRSFVFPDLLAIYRIHGGGTWTSSHYLSRWMESQSLYRILSEKLTDPELKHLCTYQTALLQCQILVGHQRVTFSIRTLGKDIMAFLVIMRSSIRLGGITAPVKLLAYVILKLSDKGFRQTKFLVTGQQYP